VHPNDWGMTIAQFDEFVKACQRTKFWEQAKKEKEFVNLYDVVAGLVKPWTQGTGCGIALRMNPEAPLRSELMVSHSWGEALEECLEALLDFSSRTCPTTTPIWFCAFAQYQAGDTAGDVGPTVAEQLELDPFGSVVQCTGKAHGMVVVHTSTARVYERLWCVYEISEALRIEAPVGIAYSRAYLQERSGKLLDLLRATTAAAVCSNAQDEDTIRKKVHEAGGFKQLDWKIFQFRFESLKEMMARTDGRWEEKLRDEFEQAEKVFLKGTFLSSNKISTPSIRLIRRWPHWRTPTIFGGVVAAVGMIIFATALLMESMVGQKRTDANQPEEEPLKSDVPSDQLSAPQATASQSSDWQLWCGFALVVLSVIAAFVLLLVCFCDRQLLSHCNDSKSCSSQADEISERLERCRMSVKSEISNSGNRTKTDRARSRLSSLDYAEASTPDLQGDLEQGQGVAHI